MADTNYVTTFLVMWIVTLALLLIVIYPRNKKLTGLAIITMTLWATIIEQVLTHAGAQYLFGFVLLNGIIGLYILLWGIVNKK